MPVWMQGTRADKTHVASQNQENLWKFVQPETAQGQSQRSNALGIAESAAVVGLGPHGAQLEKSEHGSVASRPHLGEYQGPAQVNRDEDNG